MIFLASVSLKECLYLIAYIGIISSIMADDRLRSVVSGRFKVVVDLNIQTSLEVMC